VYCGGKPLTDSDALSQFGVASTLDITVRLVGGAYLSFCIKAFLQLNKITFAIV
jgi:hypothetical protein